MLGAVNRTFGAALVVISHSPAVGEGFDRQRLLQDGRLEEGWTVYQ